MKKPLIALCLAFALASCASHGQPRVKCSGHLVRINSAPAPIAASPPPAPADTKGDSADSTIDAKADTP